jgi:hypothetical protein
MTEGCRVPVYMDDQKAFGMQSMKSNFEKIHFMF